MHDRRDKRRLGPTPEFWAWLATVAAFGALATQLPLALGVALVVVVLLLPLVVVP